MKSIWERKSYRYVWAVIAFLPRCLLCLVVEAWPRMRWTSAVAQCGHSYLRTTQISIWLSCRKFCAVLQGKRNTSWPWIACLDTEWVDLVFTWWKYPFSHMLFVVWGCSWGALHSKSHSKVCCLLMSRNKWLQQMREVQENSKTECLAVHQLLSFCQAFCWLCKGKK